MAPSNNREVAFPARALLHIRRALREETDPLATVHALHAAGYGCGEDIFGQFSRGAVLTEVDHQSFWAGVSTFFQSRGWGRLTHSAPHPGIGVLESRDWAEAEGGEESQPSCAFTAGMLSNFLSMAAGGGVAVLETTCRARGDDSCSFAFGSEDAIHSLYGHLLDGRTVPEALEQL